MSATRHTRTHAHTHTHKQTNKETTIKFTQKYSAIIINWNISIYCTDIQIHLFIHSLIHPSIHIPLMYPSIPIPCIFYRYSIHISSIPDPSIRGISTTIEPDCKEAAPPPPPRPLLSLHLSPPVSTCLQHVIGHRNHGKQGERKPETAHETESFNNWHLPQRLLLLLLLRHLLLPSLSCIKKKKKKKKKHSKKQQTQKNIDRSVDAIGTRNCVIAA